MSIVPGQHDACEIVLQNRGGLALVLIVETFYFILRNRLRSHDIINEMPIAVGPLRDHHGEPDPQKATRSKPSVANEAIGADAARTSWRIRSRVGRPIDKSLVRLGRELQR